MPLSDEEMRLLEQMERALVEEDPKFAHTLRGTRFGRATRTRIIVAAVAFLAGMALLLTGPITRQIWVGVIGFVIMLASATIGLTAWRGRQAAHEPPSSAQSFQAPDSPAGLSLIQGGRPSRRPKRPANRGPRQGFMQRLEERWNRRRDQNGY